MNETTATKDIGGILDFKLIYILIILESLFIGYTLSLMEGLEVIGYFPAIIYFLLSFSSNSKVARLIMIYAVTLTFPRIFLIDAQLEKRKSDVAIPTIAEYNAITHDCKLFWKQEDVKECQAKNEEENKKLNESKLLSNQYTLDQVQNKKKWTLLDISYLFMYMISSLVLPISIYYLQEEQKLALPEMSKQELFNHLYSIGQSKEAIKAELKFSEQSYYRYRDNFNKDFVRRGGKPQKPEFSGSPNGFSHDSHGFSGALRGEKA